MDSAFLMSLGMALLPGFLIFTFFYAVAAKLAERRLTFLQSLFISAVAVAVLLALIAAYTFAKRPLGLDKSVESLVYIVGYLVTGAVITRLARNYGTVL